MGDLQNRFVDNLARISNSMIDEKSSYAKQNKNIEDQFSRYGLTNDQFAKIISEINAAASEFITKNANASAMDLLKLEENQPLLEAQIRLAEKELEIKDKDLLLKDKELEIKDQELKLSKTELKIKEEQLKKMYAEIELINQKVETEKKQLDVMTAEIDLKGEQEGEASARAGLYGAQASTETAKASLYGAQAAEAANRGSLYTAQASTEGTQQAMIKQQKKLVARQTNGYDDNLLVKAAEFSGGLASFAVNASHPDASTAVTSFTDAIKKVTDRITTCTTMVC